MVRSGCAAGSGRPNGARPVRRFGLNTTERPPESHGGGLNFSETAAHRAAVRRALLFVDR
jgi:hypothetical protein